MKNISFLAVAALLMLAACNGGDKNKVPPVDTVANSNTNSGSREVKDEKTYCNARFGYCIDYPSDIDAQPESDNGDGRIFRDDKGNEVLRVSGSLDVNERGIEEDYKMALATDPTEIPIMDIRTSHLEKDYYEIEGLLGDRAYFRRTILKDGVFVTASCQAEDPRETRYLKLKGLIWNTLKKDRKGWQ